MLLIVGDSIPGAEPLTGFLARLIDLRLWRDAPVGAELANANEEGRECEAKLRSQARHQAELGDAGE